MASSTKLLWNSGAPKEPPPSTLPIPMVQLLSVAAHGSKDAMVAKVEVAVNGAQPSDGRSVRYLDMVRSTDQSWLVVRDSDAYHYMLSLLSSTVRKPLN